MHLQRAGRIVGAGQGGSHFQKIPVCVDWLLVVGALRVDLVLEVLEVAVMVLSTRWRLPLAQGTSC